LRLPASSNALTTCSLLHVSSPVVALIMVAALLLSLLRPPR
jgi:hypothetical protein